MRVRFIGDPLNGGEGPALLTAFEPGLVFEKGVFRDVPGRHKFKIERHCHFEIDTDGDGEPGPTVEALRAECDALNIKYHHKAGVAKLQQLLAEHGG